MTKRTKEIIDLLDEHYGTEYVCYLNHENAWLTFDCHDAQCTVYGRKSEHRNCGFVSEV